MRFFFTFVALFGLLFGLEVKYSYIPKVVYKNQIFPVTIFVKDKNNPNVTFDNTTKPIEKKPIKKVTKNGVFFTFYFKADKDTLKLPSFWVSSEDGSLMLDGVSIFVNSLNADSNFCGVIASGFEILDYDIDKNRVKIILRATEGNLEDFYINGLSGRKLLHFSRKGAVSEATYSFFLPQSEVINFSYFNTIQNRIIDLKVDLNPQNISKNMELNPKDSSFTKLKKYTFGFLSLFFLIMFLLYKDKFYLALFAVTFIGVIIFFAPLKRVCIKKGAKIYILPIKNSTVGKVANSKGEYTLYSKYKNFYKIEYKNGVIGWVKNEDLCKD